MKIYAAVLATLVSTGAIAATDADKKSCALLADLNAAIAKDRDYGKPMWEMQKQARTVGTMKADARESMVGIIQMIYNDQPFRDMTPKELRAWSYDTCVKG